MTAATLASLRTGRATVIDVDLPDDQRRRLAELGLRPGIEVGIAQRATGRGVIVDLAGSRIALDRRTAAAVTIDPTGSAPPTAPPDSAPA